MAISFTSGPCGMTKRAFLASHNGSNGLPLAKADGRGRFSTEAEAFFAKAVAAGVTFDEPVKAAPVARATTAAAPTAPATPGLPSRREYAISKGKAKAGSRGVLAYEAWQAIIEAETAGTKFRDSNVPIPEYAHNKPAERIVKREKPETVAEAATPSAPPVPDLPILQEQQNHYAVLEKKGYADLVLAFDSCYSDTCQGRAVKFCSHDEPVPPMRDAVYMGTDKSEVLV